MKTDPDDMKLIETRLLPVERVPDQSHKNLRVCVFCWPPTKNGGLPFRFPLNHKKGGNLKKDIPWSNSWESFLVVRNLRGNWRAGVPELRGFCSSLWFSWPLSIPKLASAFAPPRKQICTFIHMRIIIYVLYVYVFAKKKKTFRPLFPQKTSETWGSDWRFLTYIYGHPPFARAYDSSLLVEGVKSTPCASLINYIYIYRYRYRYIHMCVFPRWFPVSSRTPGLFVHQTPTGCSPLARWIPSDPSSLDRLHAVLGKLLANLGQESPERPDPQLSFSPGVHMGGSVFSPSSLKKKEEEEKKGNKKSGSVPLGGRRVP